jgi:ketosteroid isomerase-like protein
MICRKPIHCTAAVLILVAAFSVSSRAAANEFDRAANDASVRKTIAAYVAAFNAGRYDDLRKYWTADGDFVNEVGEAYSIAADIKRLIDGNALQRGGDQLEVAIESVRFVSQAVALVDGATKLAGRSADSPASGGRFSAVLVRQDDGWLLSAVREAGPKAGSGREQLKTLGWMVGDWTGRSNEGTIDIRVRWTDNEKFLLRSFAITVDQKTILKGTQRIGWDAAARQIRSWYFDSDGSFGAGWWTKRGDHWIVEVTGTMGDGQQATALNMYTQIDDDRYLRQSLNVRVEGQSKPDKEVRIQRQAATQ